MCSPKGGNQVQTNQTQTYTPAPAAGQAIQNALTQGQQVAQTPFQTPVAPVAGFSPQQQQAFNITGAAQGMAQPYINQASAYFSPMGAQMFANPYIGNVTAQMQNIFGQQDVQATGQAVAQAGGTGADRIAVAQGQLANQQGLAAGQTYANLYNQAAQQAQTAGFGTANLGTTAQNAALQGAQALLGTGGLQQQLLQAQMNAPYQNILQQIAWPYQNAQFNAGITSALAPGLGGTTSGVGTTTYPQQNPLASIAGLGALAYGAYSGSQGKGGATGNQGTSGYMANPVGAGGYGGAQVGYDANGNYFNFSQGTFPQSARGGRTPYDRGGSTTGSDPIADAHALLTKHLNERADYYDDPDVPLQEKDFEATTEAARARGDYDATGTYNPFRPKRIGYDTGGGAGGSAPDTSGVSISQTSPQGTDPYLRLMEEQELMRTGAGTSAGQASLPSGVSGQPVNMAPSQIVPSGQVTPIQPHIPQLNLNPPQQSSGGGKGSDLSNVANIVGSAAKIAAIVKRGGRINPYHFQEGGDAPYSIGDVADPSARDALTQALGMRAAQMRGDPVIDATKQPPLNWDAFGVGKKWDPTNPALEANKQVPGEQAPGESALAMVKKGFGGQDPSSALAGINSAIKVPPQLDPYVPRSALGLSETQPAPQTQPPPPQQQQLAQAQPPYAGASPYSTPRAAQMAQSPFVNPWVMMGLSMLSAAGQRDARGLPTPPLSAIAQGAMGGINQTMSIQEASEKLAEQAEAHRRTMAEPYVVGEDQYGRKQYGVWNPKTGQTDILKNYTGGHGDISLSGDEYLKTLPGGAKGTEARKVVAMAEGRMQPPSSFAMSRSPYMNALMDEVLAYDPAFQAQRYQVRQEFEKGTTAKNTISGIRAAMGHGEHMSDIMEQILPGASNFPDANNMRNWILKKTGDPRINDAKATMGLLAEEATRAYRGAGGAEADIQRFMSDFDTAASPAAATRVLASFVHNLNVKAGAVEQTWKDSYGGDKNFGVVTDKEQKIIDKLNKRSVLTIAPPEAIEALKAHPDKREDFDRMYGADAARAILGN